MAKLPRRSKVAITRLSQRYRILVREFFDHLYHGKKLGYVRSLIVLQLLPMFFGDLSGSKFSPKACLLISDHTTAGSAPNRGELKMRVLLARVARTGASVLAPVYRGDASALRDARTSPGRGRLDP
jgi:hypothetical protein